MSGSERLASAHDTLLRGSGFLASSLRARAQGNRGGGGSIAGPVGAKVVGNGLRELDRFLSLLIDEAAGAIAPDGFDKAAFARRRNVADKMRRFHVMAGSADGDCERLRAIGRVRECLHHCRGVVHKAGLRDDLRMAARGRRRVRPDNEPERLTVSFDQLLGICLFYAEAAERLVAACSAPRPGGRVH